MAGYEFRNIDEHLPSQVGDRIESFEEMRRQGPAIRHDGGVITTTRAAAERVFRNPQIYSSKFGPIGGAHRPLIPIENDPPEHHLYRKLLDPMFAPRTINDMQPAITRQVNELIDGFQSRGECTFDVEFAV